MDLEKLYVRAARAAARHRRHAADLPVAGTASREDAWEAFGGRLPDRPTPPGKVLDELLSGSRRPPGRHGRAALLRLRDRWLDAGRHGRRHAGRRLGPERLQPVDVAGRRSGRACGGRLGQGSAGPSGRRVRRFRHRRAGRQHRRHRLRAPLGPGAGRLRRGDRRAHRGTASPGRLGLRAARHHRPVAAAARARARRRWWACSPTTTAPSTSTTWRACWRPSRSGRRSSASRPAT